MTMKRLLRWYFFKVRGNRYSGLSLEGIDIAVGIVLAWWLFPYFAVKFIVTSFVHVCGDPFNRIAKWLNK